MDTEQLGRHYDQIAEWQAGKRKNNPQGVDYVNRALLYTKVRGTALDVGCGSGGPIMDALLSNGFSLTGIDASTEMLRIAQSRHPEVEFLQYNTHYCDITIVTSSVTHR
jgi:2-polyprenyl-3-methyl-5-hydroxy-6-metoxy-1,4-benzoquinol methylase